MKTSIIKTFFVTIGMIIFSLNVYSQDTVRYFNKTYWADTMNLLTPIGVATNEGYYLIGNCTSISQRSIFLMKTDLLGNQEWWINVDVQGNESLASLQMGTEAIITQDSCIAFVYTKRVFGNGMDYDNYLIKIRQNGTTIWNRRVGDYGIEQAFQLIQTDDGGFALFGGQTLNDTTKYYLTKTNSLGLEEWHTTYILDGYSKGLSFQQTPDGGYILSGYAYSDTSGYDTYIIKTDSLGAVEWTNNYGGQYNDCGGKVNLLANGQYLVTSCYYPNDNITRYARLSKLNSNGTMVWDSIYYTKPRCASPQTPVVFLSDSSFVTVMAYSTVSTGRVSNLLACFDLSGNILWEREFSSNLNEDVYLKDLRRTADGGFIMAGYEYTSTPQKGYLVKTDSLGLSCSVLECDSVAYHFPDAVSPPILPPPQTFFSIYPNPAQDYIVIENHSQEQNATFVLYDVVGRQVLSVVSHNQSVLPIEHLPSGVYLYQFLNPQNQILAYGKVSVVR